MKEHIGFIFPFLPSKISFAGSFPWNLTPLHRNLFSRFFTCFQFLLIALNYPGHAQTESAAMTELLQRYVRIPSNHGREKEAGIFLEQFAREKGLSVRVLTDTDSAFNLAISLYPLESRKPNILLISHMDWWILARKANAPTHPIPQ